MPKLTLYDIHFEVMQMLHTVFFNIKIDSTSHVQTNKHSFLLYIKGIIMLRHRLRYQKRQIINKEINNWVVMLNNKEIDDDDLEYICSSKTNNIQTIYLFANCITQQGLISLKRACWQNLLQIFIFNNRIGSKGCKYLTCAEIKGLTRIHLGNNEITSQGVIHLSKGNWQIVKQIALQTNKINCKGLQYLFRSNWKYINFIDISNNKITCIQILNFIKAESSRLREINLTNNWQQDKLKGQGNKQNEILIFQIEQKYPLISLTI